MKTAIVAVVAALLVPVLAAQAKNEAAAMSKTFKVDNTCKIATATSKTAALADVKVGDKVSVAYREDGATLVAEHVHVMGEPKAAKGEHKKGEAKDTGLRIHGTVTAVDAQAGTMTIEVHEHHKK